MLEILKADILPETFKLIYFLSDILLLIILFCILLILMNLGKGLFLAAITTPIIVFLMISLTTTLFLIVEYITIDTTINYMMKGIIGGFIGGGFYALICALISIPLTFLIGYPMAKYVIQKELFSVWIVLLGAVISGAITFPLLIILLFWGGEVSKDFIYIVMFIGAISGLFNGFIFWLCMRKIS